MCCCVGSDIFLMKADLGWGGSSTSYTNSAMKGRRFRLIFDKHIFLQEGVDWQCKPNGGFDLQGNYTMGDDTILIVQFY